MTLAAGTRIGPYEVTGSLGAGGMGEVYRARDARLNRDVAVKIVPDLFAADADRLARFDREAHVLAALNHPNIAQIHGLEQFDTGRALVMELVDGEDLAQRIARGPLPVDEALPIAKQIADALEAAHELGIIHRDLKPANIRLRPDGTVKVLDFGLAKALDPPASSAGAGLANSPTLTSPVAMTRQGLILGTAAYMAPEQAKGKTVDRRADVWAFGCALYEMLTGRRAFPGDDVTETLAAVVRAEPDWAALPPETHPAIRRLLTRCLEKNPRERASDIGMARIEINEALKKPAPAATPARPGRAWIPWTVAALASVAALAFGVAWRARPPVETRVIRTSILPPAELVNNPALRFAISPDGRRVAFTAPDSTGQIVLWVRPLDALTAQPLAGTARASAPFWSWDSRTIAFIAEGKLKKIDAAGGPVFTLADSTSTPPGSWNRDNVILFTPRSSEVHRVSASGGKPVPVTTLDRAAGETIHILPVFLPDGRHFLYTTAGAGGRVKAVFVGSVDGGAPIPVLPETVSNAMYGQGHLLYLQDTTLVAHRFDASTLTLSGEPVPIAEHVMINATTGTGAFSVSQAGLLAYQSGSSAASQLTWMDRTGKRLATLGERGLYYSDVRLSPDGKTVSVTLGGSAIDRSDVWLLDATGARTRFTFAPTSNFSAAWSGDGSRLAFSSRRKSALDLFQKPVSMTAGEEVLFEDEKDKHALSWSPDGKFLLYNESTGLGIGKLMVLPLTGERKPFPFLQTPGNQVPAQFSPDGRWVAYTSSESGRNEVYAAAFPGAGAKRQVSVAGGFGPLWRRDGRELFFISGQTLMAATMELGPSRANIGDVKALFALRVPPVSRSSFGVTPDGQRILVNALDEQGGVTPITIVTNWMADLEK